MALFSVISAADAPITKDFTKVTMPDGTVEVVRKLDLQAAQRQHIIDILSGEVAFE